MESKPEEVKKEGDPKVITDQDGKMKVKAEMLYQALKAMTAMKLCRDDNQPAQIIDRLYLGSIGAAFNKESLQRNEITHILTCADKIQARFKDVRTFLLLS